MPDRFGRPDDAPDPNNPLLVAARYNDAEAEETRNMEETCERLGLNANDMMYVAEQRAVRYALIQTGDAEKLRAMQGTNMAQTFRPTVQQQAIIDFVLPTYLDAIAIGWRARGIELS